MHSFFVSCPLSFENELIQEIMGFWFQMMDLDGLPTREVLPEFTEVPGGVEFKTKMHLGLQINLFSKLALRVLLRIGAFEARYFDQFEKGLTKIEIEKYLDPQKMNIQIESGKSRLFHEGNLLESASKIFNYDKDAQQTLFLRLNKDRVMVSLDTSGEHLHFRGYRKHQGEAPIRENLASLILQLAEIPSAEEQILFDPYCGSGTFFFEAQIKNYPNLKRDYAFLKFKNIPALFKSETWMKNYRWPQWPKNIKYIGVEKNKATYEKALLNQQEFGPIDLTLINADCETYDLKSELPIYLVTNPPYGERSASGNVVETLARFEKLENLKKLVVIHPEGWKFKFSRLKLARTVSLSNQGLKTVLSIFN